MECVFGGKVSDLEENIKNIPYSGLWNTGFPKLDKDICRKN